MRRFFLILLLAMLLVAPVYNLAGRATVPSHGSSLSIPGWTLTYDDEFNGTSLDKPNYVRYWGGTSATWWNGDDALIVQNGLLRLKMTKEDVVHNGQTYHYTAGGFTQLTAQTYGRWVIRARLPKGVGTQSYVSLWRQDFHWPPEIDFAEVVGIRPQENIFTQHYLQGGENLSEVSKLEGMDFSTDFHEYTVIWEPGTLTWLVDGVQKFKTTQKFDAFPMNLAVGDFVGTCDGFAECPNASTTFPEYLDIDYIRIYKK